MSWWKCFQRNGIANFPPSQLNSFSLPAPLPDWPQGSGFACGTINLGEIEVLQVSNFQFVWGCYPMRSNSKGVSFYRPMGLPHGFHCLGHCCHSANPFPSGFLLAARETSFCTQKPTLYPCAKPPALAIPTHYILLWSSCDKMCDSHKGCGFFWLPVAPHGYVPMGLLVTNTPKRPDLDEVRCVRQDLTDKCQMHHLTLDIRSSPSKFPFRIWSVRPKHRGIHGKGVSVGTFFCASYPPLNGEPNIACLRNLDPQLHAMPNLKQVHALVNHYGPMVHFHPDEIYLPSSVSWFFKNGALLCGAQDLIKKPIKADGSNLPAGGKNDGRYWIDLPNHHQSNIVKFGNIESAKLYVHVKPALGGTFTDIVMWVFCPFNGPVTLRIGLMNFPLDKIGQHVGDWEHFTLRISNFNGKLLSMYFSQHSGGEWVDASDLEYHTGNRAIVYSSKYGHACFPHQGTYIQGSTKLGIGVRNDAFCGGHCLDSSTRYEVVAAEYLATNEVKEPCWLQFMREWGPTVVYNLRAEFDKAIKFLPGVLRLSVMNMFNRFPLELYGEEGPTGPKEKDNWFGDERG